MKKGENIYKRKDGRWEGRFKKNRTKNGRIVYGYVYGRRYSEVKEKLLLKKSQYIASIQKTNDYHGTVEEFMTSWLEKNLKETIKISTYSNYRGKLAKHIFPFLGKKRLNELNRQDIEAFIRHLESNSLATSTIHSMITLVKTAIKRAILEERIQHNPCKNVVLPPIRKPVVHALSIKEQRKLEKNCLLEDEISAVIIALYTGMRIGEISGLRWTDIDWSKNIIYVRRTISRIPSTTELGKTEIVIDLPKTESSIRSIPLSTNIKKYLRKKEKSSMSNYVVNCNTHFTEPRLINYRFKKTLKEAGIQPVHFHSLRHTFATRCLEQGVDIATLSKILGHASVKMTLDTYTDSLWDSRKSALNKVGKSLLI